MNLAWKVARALSDGRFHSGQALAEDFGVSRTVIWRAIHALETVGLEIHSVTGKGYRLPEPVEWLDSDALAEALPEACRDRLAALTVMDETDSTNLRLLADGPPSAGRLGVCIAEHQSGGRGRRGRRWQSPPGGGVWLSVSWLFERQPDQLPALGLAAGLAARRALLDAGLANLELKWPNDVVHDGRKLGGLLAELRAESNGPAFVVIGVGINWLVPAVTREGIVNGGGLPVTDVAELSAAGGIERPARGRVAADLITGLAAMLAEYEQQGFEGWREEFADADALAGRRVWVDAGGREFEGTARGIDLDGALLVETASGTERVIAGDVSVRARS